MEIKDKSSNLMHMKDFTEDAYVKLLSLLKTNYSSITFTELPDKNSKYVLWRHDVDLSLNRAFQLAKMEQKSGIRSTYLLDPHSLFYNVAEKSQVLLLHKILEMGHSLGLHLDANFWNVQQEGQLDDLIDTEATWLESLLGIRPEALSFHNPSALHLTWRADSYGGLVNCYSQLLMDSVPYVSDSNGYWRYRRLFDVISNAEEPCMQVLTHPGWWQERPMPPRERIFRAAFGRATATLHEYDSSLASMNRENVDDTPREIRQLASVINDKAELFDYLWNRGYYSVLFMELWVQRETQIIKLARTGLRETWRALPPDVSALFEAGAASLDGWQQFEMVFGHAWQSVAGIEPTDHQRWEQILNQIVHGRAITSPAELRNGCDYLAGAINALAQWGLNQTFEYDGLTPSASTWLPRDSNSDSSLSDNPNVKLSDNA